jgi:hypothetical protein
MAAMTGLKAIFAALMLGASLASPAKADGDIGISFGYDEAFTGFEPCGYYRYYDTPPPWGLPDDYCSDLVSFEPVFFDGFWYRGPIYHHHHHGKDEFWLHGGWHEKSRSGEQPASISWQDRGGSLHGFRADFHPGRDVHAGGEAAHAGAGPSTHGESNPAVHSADAPAVHAGTAAPSVPSGGEAPGVHAAAPSSGESHSSGGGSGGGHDSSSGSSHH